MFFLEESSIAKYGHPFFGVDFKIWVRGPVLEDVFFDLDEESPVLFKDYIKRADYDKTLFVSKAEFNDDEFSENDIELLDSISRFAKHKNAADLVRYSHKEESLWEKSAMHHGVYEDLIAEKIKTTDYLIDFALLLEKNDFLKERYENAKENLEAIKSLKY